MQAGTNLLLDSADAEFEPGQVTLIVGGSGVGKSVLLKILAGLINGSEPEFDVRGEILLGPDNILTSTAPGSVGIVFQHFALFDEFSAADNVQFAIDHRHKTRARSSTQAGKSKQRPNDLLQELNVPTNVRTAALSGGQQQRVAIARTLAFEPDILLYDEPTSGLDGATADQVADLIRQTHDSHPTTSIIVTHDYQSLPRIADAVYLLDAQTKSLRRIPADDWPKLRELLHEVSFRAEEETEPAPSIQSRIGSLIGDFFEVTTRVAHSVIDMPLRLLPLWRSPRWGLRFAWHYLRLVAGPSAWLYIAVSGMIIGFVSTYFIFRFLPYVQYTEPLIIENLLHAIGFSLYRILVPVLSIILIAARSGAAVASDVGGKSYGKQMDALTTLGAPPKRYLLSGILYAFLIGTPLLLAIGYVVATVTSLLAFVATHPEHGSLFWDLHFHRELREPGAWWYGGTWWLLAKTLTCAAGMALISYYRGARPKSSSRGVSEGITSAILWSTLFVLFVQFVFSFFEFD